MIRRVVPSLIAFMVLVLLMSTIPMLGHRFNATNPALTVYTHGHDVEARQALNKAGIPGLHFVDRQQPVPYLRVLVAAAQAVALQLAIFFGVFYFVRRLVRRRIT
jgi:hypothetical protein